MPAMTLGPPPAADLQAQRGPFSMAAEQPQAPPGPPPPGGPGPDMGAPGQSLEGGLIMASITIKQLLRADPAMAPWVSQAVNILETGVRTILAQRRQTGAPGGMMMPAQSATPPNEPGAGLPF